MLFSLSGMTRLFSDNGLPEAARQVDWQVFAFLAASFPRSAFSFRSRYETTSSFMTVFVRLLIAIPTIQMKM